MCVREREGGALLQIAAFNIRCCNKCPSAPKAPSELISARPLLRSPPIKTPDLPEGRRAVISRIALPEGPLTCNWLTAKMCNCSEVGAAANTGRRWLREARVEGVGGAGITAKPR